MGNHEYGVLFLFQTYGKLREYKNAFQEVFVNKINFFYISIFLKNRYTLLKLDKDLIFSI